ncbi:AEC family transporter [Actinobacillus genomosp. 2]|uniref:AEC family transporter n=1 Tax=Actinobacillus genomosp. 2 TaxID=230709 RepID=UPI0024423890|nr:AEC family transporter [Actinobacillus genomosp. 2]WGE32376.1 AEC family transporter [Actinobacillus genomosp. 2]
MFFESLQFSIGVMLPTILLMLLGIFLRRRKFVDDAFCNTASKVMFNFALPTMLFLNVVKSPLDYSKDLNLIFAGLSGTLILYFIAEWWAAKYIRERGYRCIFTQGVFRSNAAILGLALTINAYGETGLASASIYTASLVILFNVLSVITILNSLSDQKPNAFKLALAVTKNPLIQAIVLGIIVNYLQIPIPKPLMQTAQSLSNITLPMALICIGATLDFKALSQFRRQSAEENELNRVVIYASFSRLILTPIFLFILGKWFFALNPMQLGILFITASTPTAAATYAMVRAYGGSGTGSANLIGITTIGSMFTASLGLLLLHQLNWI